MPMGIIVLCGLIGVLMLLKMKGEFQLKNIFVQPVDMLFSIKLISGLVYILSLCSFLLALLSLTAIYNPSQGFIYSSPVNAVIVYGVCSALSLFIFKKCETSESAEERE